MILFSLKQLFRRPGKVLLFFLLMSAVTAMLVFSAVNSLETQQRIATAESQFTTIATVTQNRQPGDPLLTVDLLEFDGAEYIVPPETRPYYLARNEVLTDTGTYTNSLNPLHVVTFMPLEDFVSPDTPMRIRIMEAYFNRYDHTLNYWSVDPSTEKDLEPGDEVYIEQLYVDEPMAIQVGKTYMASLFYDYEESLATDQDIYRVSHSPVSSQCDPATGELLEGSLLPRAKRRMDEVTADFWEPGGLGEVWMRWVEQLGQSDRHWLPVLPTGGLAVLPAFHDKTAYITRGREITAEEFDAGDRVCLLSSQVALGSGIRIGDKIRLPMQFALYGFKPGRLSPLQFALGYFYSPLNTRGEAYEPFFDAEYEVVGFYSMTGTPTNELVAGDAIIVPKRSIAESDENNIVWYTPMNNWNTSFQIPNGTIASFNSALHDAVLGSMQLQIVYDDNGYEEIVDSLTTARLRSFLLLGVGTLAAGAVIVLLLYFFVWKEKKRTALEQAMGMPHSGSYLSLMAGILAVAIPAVMLGSGLSALAHEAVTHSNKAQQSVLASTETDDLEQEVEQLSFSREYSLWAQNERNAEEIPLDTMEVKAQTGIYFLFPFGILLLTGGLALFLVHRTLRMELINLLNVQRE